MGVDFEPIRLGIVGFDVSQQPLRVEAFDAVACAFRLAEPGYDDAFDGFDADPAQASEPTGIRRVLIAFAVLECEVIIQFAVQYFPQQTHAHVRGGLKVLLIHHDGAAETIGPPMLFVFNPWRLVLPNAQFESGHDHMVVVRILYEVRISARTRESG